jgi:digeranylgeranylglycerophospholipid reductase
VSARAKEETIPARAVVIACGFAPGLLWRLGLGTFGDSALGAQAEVEAPGTAEVAVYFGDVAPGFFAWLVPTAPALARAGLLARKRPGDYLKRWLDSLAREGRIRSAAVNISYGGVPLKPLAHSFGTRMVVVGDAAGQVKPTTGGGIYYGLLCADIAAATLHRALVDDDLSAKRLAAYERAWRRKLGRELQTGYWARKLFESLSNRRIDRLFKLIEAGGIDEALLKAADLSFDWHGRTMLRLLKYQVIARTLKFGRLPFSFQKSPR